MSQGLHVIKLCRIMYIMYWMEVRHTKTFQNVETFQTTSPASYSNKQRFIDIHIGAQAQQGNVTPTFFGHAQSPLGIGQEIFSLGKTLT